MSMIKESIKYLALKDDEPPPKRLVTDGDILIKNLAEKQRNTNVTINDYLRHEKSFEKVSEHISLTSCHSGTTSLEQFKSVIGRIEDIEYLRSAGLENDDIQLLWNYRQNNLDVKYKNVERSVLENKIAKILTTLRGYETQKSVVENVTNKRSLDEELLLAAKPNSTTTKLLKFAIDNEQKSNFILENPMNNYLKEVERDRFSYLDNENLDVKRVQKRIRNINARINNIEKKLHEENKEGHKLGSSEHLYVENSKWDIKQTEILEISKCKVSKTYTCKSNNYYTIKKGEIVKLNEVEIKEKGLEISKHKLNVDEIKKLPRFDNYSPGQPSNILYIKNLPKSITEDDLKDIFKDFQDVTFRIMTGRMKGQVFVTFPDTNQASQALVNINGLLINNKPIVMEYGKKKNT